MSEQIILPINGQRHLYAAQQTLDGSIPVKQIICSCATALMHKGDAPVHWTQGHE